ncbi:hypothetical protein V6N13_088835 [Hibiscus sabdariffa]
MVSLYGGDESWQWRKERKQGNREARAEEQEHGLESWESVTGKRMGSHRHITGVVAEDKRELLDTCVVVWCKSIFHGRVLIEELWLERIEEMVEVTCKGSIISVQVEEVEVVHSHDIICPCDRESESEKSVDALIIE